MMFDQSALVVLSLILVLVLLVGAAVTEQKRQHAVLKQFAYFLRPPSALPIARGNNPDLRAISGVSPDGRVIADITGLLPAHSGLLFLVDPGLEMSWWFCQELKSAPDVFAGRAWLLVVTGSALAAERLIHRVGADEQRTVLIGDGDAISAQLAIRFNPAAVLVEGGFATAKGQISTAAHVTGFVKNAEHLPTADTGVVRAEYTQEVSIR